MTPRTRAPYYGWVVLFVAAAAMVGTLPGRTQGLGLVTEPLLADLQHRPRRLRAAESLGDADRRGGRHRHRPLPRSIRQPESCSPSSPSRLASSVVLMSRVTTFAELAIAVTLTRALGQSALSVVSIAMVGHWFVRRIDMAMAIYSVVAEHRLHDRVPASSARWSSRAAGAPRGSPSAPRFLRGWCRSALLLVRRSPESIGLAADGDDAAGPSAGTGNQQPGTGTGTRNRNSESAGYTLKRCCTPAVLGLRDRRRALRPRRVRHRPLQRIDSRRARLRPEHLLPDARRHRDDRARRKFHRRLARAFRSAEPPDGDLAVRADRRPCSRCRTSPRWRWRWRGRR